MRSSLSLAATLALCAALGACGSSGSSHARAVRTAARPAAAPPAPSRARALAYARAVNLSAADVPGFTPSPRREAETQQERDLQRRLRQCVGQVRLGGGLVESQSASFKLKRGLIDLGVSSEVAVARTPALAAAELTAIRNGRVRRCFSSYLDQLLAGERRAGAQFSPVSIATGVPPAPGSGGSFGWRIVASFKVAHVRLSLYVDMLGFIVGPARVTLVSSGVLRPFPAAIQQRLFGLLLARATSRSV